MPFNSGWRNDLLLDLPMTSELHNPTKGRTDNVGTAGGELHGVFGAGAAEPTKLTDRHGYNFDGAGDHIQCSSGFSLSSRLVSVMLTFGGVNLSATDYIFDWGTVGGNSNCGFYCTGGEIRFFCGSLSAVNDMARIPVTNYAGLQGLVQTIVGVYDGADIHGYANGSFMASAVTPVAPDGGSHPITVGCRTSIANYYDNNIYHVGMADFACSPLMVQEYHLSMLQELNNI